MTKIRLIKIKCAVPDESDKDEMYLKYGDKQIWPTAHRFFRMDVDDEVKINLELQVALGWVAIELWDFDYLSANDHLGTFNFKVDTEIGKYSCSMEPNTAKTRRASYYLEWEIV